VYFVEIDNEDNRKEISTWHNWVFNAVDNHTGIPSKRKDTCVRVVFADGHHIDLPIRYKKNGTIELAHKSKGWLKSDPQEFSEWFNQKAKTDPQLRRIVRYLKAWKNYRELKNTNLKFPSGFALTILVTNNYVGDDFDDVAFRKTVEKIEESLNNRFECLRPTTPKDDDLFEEYSKTRKDDFLNALGKLVKACQKAENEDNFKKASQYLQKHFGDRFPTGKDESSRDKSSRKSRLIGTPLAPKPYAK
jgi:hypothetical protein